jgi:type I restriction enzyme S subunit
MREGWRTRKLREVCELVNGRAYSKPELLAAGKYRVLRVGNFFTNGHWYYSDMELEEKKYCDSGDLLYAWSASFGPRIWTGGKVIYHYHIWKVVHDCTQIDKMFLFYFFQWDTEKIKEDQGTGTTMLHVSMGSMNERVINLPPLPEQQRIVALLDQAFAGLATATANAEQNLQNARALFESHLQSVFSQRGEGWVEATLGEVCEMYQPKTIGLKDLVSDGKYPVFGANGIIGRYDRFNHEEPQLLITCRGATCGSVNISEPFSWITGNAMVVRPLDAALDLGYLEYAFRGGINTSEAITGSAQPQITRTNLLPLPISFPLSVEEQKCLAASFRSIAAETQRLTRLYERKLAALEELKKSLLHQAFNGEL